MIASTGRGRRIARVWARALVACALFLGVALTVQRFFLDPGPRPIVVRPDDAPEYVMPNGERRRAVVVAPPGARAPARRGGDPALLWWSIILCAVTLGGAVSRTLRIRAEAKRERG